MDVAELAFSLGFFSLRFAPVCLRLDAVFAKAVEQVLSLHVMFVL